MRHLRLLSLFLLFGTATAVLPATAQAPCATPFKAVDSLLHWQQEDHTDMEKAARCLDGSRVEPDTLQDRARMIKEVLDSRGLWVEMEKIPTDPDFTNATEQHRYVLFPKRLPDFYLERVEGRWLWSAATVAGVPSVHAEAITLDLTRFEKRLPQWALAETFGIKIWKYIAILLLLFIGLLVRLLVTFLVTGQVRRMFTRLGITLADEVLGRVGKPIGTLAMAGVLAIFVPGLHLPVRVTQVALLATQVLAAMSVVWAGYRLIDVFTHWLMAKAELTETKLDDQLVPLVRTSLKVFTVALGVIFVLQNMNVDVGSLLAGLGIGGLAFALAAKDTVANLFGALTIFLDRPFQIGDWVVVSGVEGIIESVGFRSTKVRTFYNSLVSVPNAKVGDSTVDNYGQRRYRRCKATLGVTYDTTPDQLQAFVEGIRAIIQANPATRKDYYEVHFRDFGASSLDIMLYFFFDVSSWSDELKARHDLFIEILRLAKDLNVDFAFPTQTLHVESLHQGEATERHGPQELAPVIRAFGPEGERARPTGQQFTDGYLAATAQVRKGQESEASGEG